MSYNVMQRSNFFRTLLAVVAACTLAVVTAHAQADKVTVPLSDPARPSNVKINLLNGSITVTGYDGKDIVVEAKVRGDSESSSTHGGMKRIPMTSTGLSVEEEYNQVDIRAQSVQRTIDITVQVPRRTSLHLKTVNNGDISVAGVEGEFDVDDVNGDVTLRHISGNAVAHALNGKLLVTFDRINAQKPMAFSSLNGDVDVTFPPDLRANLSMASDRGDVFSDFDVQVDPRAPAQTVVNRDSERGRFKVNVDKVVRGKINGGGQEIQFKNFNGNIYIRKGGGAAPAAATPRAQ